MLRAFALMMICVLLVSHGSMSVAAPHGAVSAIGHGHDHSPEMASDHDDVASDALLDEAGDGNAGLDVPHAHPAADEARLGAELPPRLAIDSMRDLPAPDAPLMPTRSAPLLEPPSA